MFGFDIFIKLLKLLNSDKHSPAQLAGGLSIGMIMGLTPWFSAHHLILFFVLLLFNVNFSMALLGMGVFGIIGYLFDPVFHDFGFYLLQLDFMKETYTQWYNSAFILTRFNNTVLMGSFVASILLSPIMFPIFLFLIKRYRKHVLKWFKDSFLGELLKESSTLSLYDKVEG